MRRRDAGCSTTARDRLAADGGLVLRLPSEGSLDWGALRAHLPHGEGLIHLVDRARRIAGPDAG